MTGHRRIASLLVCLAFILGLGCARTSERPLKGRVFAKPEAELFVQGSDELHAVTGAVKKYEVLPDEATSVTRNKLCFWGPQETETRTYFFRVEGDKGIYQVNVTMKSRGEKTRMTKWSAHPLPQS